MSLQRPQTTALLQLNVEDLTIAKTLEQIANKNNVTVILLQLNPLYQRRKQGRRAGVQRIPAQMSGPFK